MVCMIDLIDEVETIENSKRLQRDQGAGHREPFRYSYIWERKAAFFSPWQILAFHMTSSIPTGAHKTTKNLILSVTLSIFVTLANAGVQGRRYGANDLTLAAQSAWIHCPTTEPPGLTTPVAAPIVPPARRCPPAVSAAGGKRESGA